MARRRRPALVGGVRTRDTTVYAICPGRGFDDVVTVLGADFDGELVRKDAKRFAAHLDNEFAAVCPSLGDSAVGATNWRAEHAIRPAVVTRKVCGGNRTCHGADTQQSSPASYELRINGKSTSLRYSRPCSALPTQSYPTGSSGRRRSRFAGTLVPSSRRSH